jgi:hypothetical protein
MNPKFAIGVVLASAALISPLHAKKPVAADEVAVRDIIAKVYEGYSISTEDTAPEGTEAVEGGPDTYQPPYTDTLGTQVARWSNLMKATDELYNMNSFDWYCQCQDFDNKTAKIVKQSYKSTGKDRIDGNILFSPGWVEKGQAGAPLLFRFKREGGAWKLDDLRFDGGGTLRRDLDSDIKDATRDQAKASP